MIKNLLLWPVKLILVALLAAMLMMALSLLLSITLGHQWVLNHLQQLITINTNYLKQFGSVVWLGQRPSEVAHHFIVSTQHFLDQFSVSANYTAIKTIVSECASLFILRACTWLMALPLFLLVAVIALIDGFGQRYIRKICGGRDSALIYHQAKHMVSFSVLMSLWVLLICPLPISPAWIILSFAAWFGLSLHTMVLWFKKYI